MRLFSIDENPFSLKNPFPPYNDVYRHLNIRMSDEFLKSVSVKIRQNKLFEKKTENECSKKFSPTIDLKREFSLHPIFSLYNN